MAGRIRDSDIELVRERVSLAELIGETVQLKSAGSGRVKGLCPFHDEKSPSFNVNDAAGFYHCFGCGASGDAISYLRETDHLGFIEAIEFLARRANVTLVYEDTPGVPPGQQNRNASQRLRMVEANRLAAEWFHEQLAGPDAAHARVYLADRGFNRDTAGAYNVGYAPEGWDLLVKHLQGRGYTPDELIVAGIASQGRQGPIDRFRNRVVWPIREMNNDIVGFGARKLSTDPADDSPKYLNTPETPIYKKSHVLYGLDRAKKEIGKRRQVVLVEGYTDVMACHLAGIPTAVATCGTSFTNEHISVLRRILMDDGVLRGEVVYLFDGDQAGQKAALKAFGDDQKFVAQTFIAIAPDGMDPCELRLTHGDEAVRSLIANRIPLIEFALRQVLAGYDLTIPEGRVSALTATAPLVGQIKDVALRPEYARALAGWLGMPTSAVDRKVRDMTARGAGEAVVVAVMTDPGLLAQREVMKIAVQEPALLGTGLDDLPAEAFTDPALRRVRDLVMDTLGAGGLPVTGWTRGLRDRAPEDLRLLVTALAVEGIGSRPEQDLRLAAGGLKAPDAQFAQAQIVRLRTEHLFVRLAQIDVEMVQAQAAGDTATVARLGAAHMPLAMEAVALKKQHRGD